MHQQKPRELLAKDSRGEGYFHSSSWIVAALSALIFLSGCTGKSKSKSSANAIAAIENEKNQDTEQDVRPTLSLKLSEGLEINKATTIDAISTGAVTWQWTQVSGPGTMTIKNADAEDALISADQDGVYVLGLSVSDQDGESLSAQIEVLWDTTAPSLTLSQEVRAFQAFTLDASVGSDAVTVAWSQVSGPGQIAFSQAQAASTSVSATLDGTYVLRFSAADRLGNAGTADMTLIWDSASPTVSLGQDRFTNKEIVLDATTADATRFSWTQVSGPAQMTFGSANLEDTSIKTNVDGSYVLRLSITKSSGKTASDDIVITWDTTPPAVNAGLDRSSKFRTTLDATTSGALAFQWNKVSGPGKVEFSDPKSEDTAMTANQSGTYELELLVIDASGNTAIDRIVVILDYDVRVFVKQISSGGSHSCAILDDGLLSCWGYNFDGELGYGDDKDRTMPPAFTVKVSASKRALSISASYSHTCAILDDKSVKCWGQNTYGELGYGDTQGRLSPSAQSINLGEGRSAKMIATGFSHSCALLDDSSVKCWGGNSSGQLGLGDFVNRSSPSAVALNLGGNHTAKSISLGAYHSCAILDDDTVKCWGSSSNGQLGLGNKEVRNAPPSQAIGTGLALKAKALITGHYHTCAMLFDASITCWGMNNNGQLGLGDTLERNSPSAALDFGAGKKGLSLSAGLSHSCAIIDDGTVQCWGGNEKGQLGYSDVGSHLSPSGVAVALGEARIPKSISAGRLHTCAILDDNTMKCWGQNSYGQLGNGKVENLPTPPSEVIGYGKTPGT